MTEPVVFTNGQATATLYPGDCLEILPTLEKAVDMIFTDPPYGHNNNSNGDLIARWEAALGREAVPESEWRPISNDGTEASGLFRSFLRLAYRTLAPGCCCCCCCAGGGGPNPQFARWSLWMDEIFQFKQMVIWDKGPMGMGWHYRRSYEAILIGQVPGAACRWFDTTKRVENIIRPGQCGKIIPSRTQHPTEKPPALSAHFIKLHSQAGEVVLDPFMGHGSTGESAVKLGRNFIGIELERAYFDIAVKRIKAALAQPSLFGGEDG
jgi:DNA modification methylase